MCFSASASFGAALLLVITSAYGIFKTKRKHERMLLTVPLVFAAQQLCEGLIWLTLTGTIAPTMVAWYTYGFLFFALLFWPIWTPFAFYYCEHFTIQKKLLQIPLAVGIITALAFLVHLLTSPVQVTASCNHIVYNLGLDNSIGIILSVLYLFATLTPLFISTIQYMNLLGYAFALSYLLSYFFYAQFMTSVWCFFAALLSIFLVYIVLRLAHPQPSKGH